MKKLLAGIVALGIAGLVYAACAPDLIVTSVSYSTSTGLFSSVVKNRGTTATAGGVNITVVYTVGGVQQATGSVAGPLAAGASVTVGSTAYTIPTGTYTIIASADNPTSLIAESQETNNQRSQIVTVGAPPAAVNVMDYGATGNGTTNDTTAIKNAFAAAFATPTKTVRFPVGTYYLGAHSSATIIFNLSSYGNGLTLISEGATFLLNTTVEVQPRVFFITGQNNISFQGDWHFQDLGGDNYYPALVKYQGATAITVGGNSSFISIDKMYTLNMQGGFMAIPDTGVGTTNNITINEIHGLRTMYVFNLQHQGNQVTVGLVDAVNCGRPFFVFGVDGVTATVVATNNAIGYHSFIAQYGGPNTRNVTLNLTDTRPYSQRQQVLTLAHLNTLGAASVMENIDVTIALNYNTAPFANSYVHGIVHLASYTHSTSGEISSSNHTWSNITINGVRGASPYLVYSGFTSLTPKGTMNLPTGTLLPSGFTNLFDVTYF